jgi:hypothetical protein
METYIVQARCSFSGYTDVWRVVAEDAIAAVEQWKKSISKLGQEPEYRYPKPIACKLEHFKVQHTYMDNLPVNIAHSGNSSDTNGDHELVGWSELTAAEQKDAIEWMRIEKNFEKEFSELYPDGAPF